MKPPYQKACRIQTKDGGEYEAVLIKLNKYAGKQELWRRTDDAPRKRKYIRPAEVISWELCENFVRTQEDQEHECPEVCENQDGPDRLAAEITRCRGCRYNTRNPRPWKSDDLTATYIWCEAIRDYTNGDGYCSEGKPAGAQETEKDPGDYIKRADVLAAIKKRYKEVSEADEFDSGTEEFLAGLEDAEDIIETMAAAGKKKTRAKNESA